jgi:hypothetical protein
VSVEELIRFPGLTDPGYWTAAAVWDRAVEDGSRILLL